MLASTIRSVLVVGAHAFDAEVIAGPLVAAVCRAGGSATLLHLSLGEQGHPNLEPRRYREQKRREAAAAAARLGCDWMTFGQPDGFIPVNDEIALQICDVVRSLKPDMVITHWSGSWHKDHRAAHRLTVDGVFYAALPTLEREAPAHAPDRLFFGENWEDGEDFLADWAVDVTDGIEAWRNGLREYALATGLSEFPYFDYYSSLYRLRGCVSGFGQAQFFAAQSSSTMSGVRQFLRGSVDGEQTEERL